MAKEINDLDLEKVSGGVGEQNKPNMVLGRVKGQDAICPFKMHRIPLKQNRGGSGSFLVMHCPICNCDFCVSKSIAEIEIERKY